MAVVRASSPGEASPVRAAPGGVDETPEPGSFDLRYVTDTGLCQATPAEACSVSFETALPVRGFVSYKPAQLSGPVVVGDGRRPRRV